MLVGHLACMGKQKVCVKFGMNGHGGRSTGKPEKWGKQVVAKYITKE
jgi:hypothetical protein